MILDSRFKFHKKSKYNRKIMKLIFKNLRHLEKNVQNENRRNKIFSKMYEPIVNHVM